MTNFKFKNSRFVQNVIKKMGNLNGTISVKRGRPVVNMFLNMSNVLGWRKNLSLVKVILVFASRCSKIIRQQSVKGLVLQLKIASVLLQQSMGGYKVPDVTLLGQRQSRNGQGLPRNWIPAIHRAHLRRGDAKYFKFWMTLFAVYRVLDFPALPNFKSITSPNGKDFSFLLGEYSAFICGSFRRWLLSFVSDKRLIMIKGLSGDPLGAARKLLVEPFLISSSSPSVRAFKERGGPVVPTPLSTSPAGILQSLKVWYLPENDSLRDTLFSFAKMTGNTWMINRMESWVKMIPKDLFLDTAPGYLGKVACLDEPAGKIRIVALVDCWTQWIMHPLFSAISLLLSRIPMDGTLNQRGPYDRLWELKPNGPFYCYDLSSATDRLPIVFQMALLSAFFGSWFADLWSRLLVGRPYIHIDDSTDPVIKTKLYYQVGQPMGAKSSFHMMALFHHSVIQWAAFRTGCQEWFQFYAIVGDDVVIADPKVAREYLIIMDQLGVSVGLHKSLVSSRPRGRVNHGLCSEFIKKTYFSKLRNSPPVDVSGLPVSRWYMATKTLSSGLDLCRDFNLSLNQFLTLLGFGYKVRGGLSKKLSMMSKRCRHRILAYYSPRGVERLPFSDWISMKTINSRYRVTLTKALLIMNNQVVDDLKAILAKLESDSFSHLIDIAKSMITVKRDREYYGTIRRGSDRINVFQDLATYQNNLRWGYHKWVELTEDGTSIEYHNDFNTDIKINMHAKKVDQVQFVLDQLTELVYRPAFSDLLIKIRDIRNTCEEMLESAKNNPEMDTQSLLCSLDGVQDAISDLSSQLSGLPLPKEIYKKVESEIVEIDSRLVKSWERYATTMRSTKS